MHLNGPKVSGVSEKFFVTSQLLEINYLRGGSFLPVDEISPYLDLYLSSESMPFNRFPCVRSLI